MGITFSEDGATATTTTTAAAGSDQSPQTGRIKGGVQSHQLSRSHLDGEGSVQTTSTLCSRRDIPSTVPLQGHRLSLTRESSRDVIQRRRKPLPPLLPITTTTTSRLSGRRDDPSTGPLQGHHLSLTRERSRDAIKRRRKPVPPLLPISCFGKPLPSLLPLSRTLPSPPITTSSFPTPSKGKKTVFLLCI